MDRPRIAVTLSNPDRAADPADRARKNTQYLVALEAAGAVPLPLMDPAPDADRTATWAAMHGLLITGGADLDPARYGAARHELTATDPGRDALDAEAWAAAGDRGVPVLGICRGMQAINAFTGGAIVQHVDGHLAEPGTPVVRHPIRIEPDSRLGRLVPEPHLEVNSYHHQAVAPEQLGEGLRVAAVADHEGTTLVEALESTDPERWLVGIQCHPERTESSPPVLEALWTDFVAACRRRATRS